MKEKAINFFEEIKKQRNALSITFMSITLGLLIILTAVLIGNSSQKDFIIEKTTYGTVLVQVTEHGSEKTKLSIPNGVTHIGRGAFLPSILSLVEVSIPSSVEEIGFGAFSGCLNLEKVNFANNSKLEAIEESAFEGCIQLNKVTIPSSVDYFGERAFRFCEKAVITLESTRLPLHDSSSFNVKALIVDENIADYFKGTTPVFKNSEIDGDYVVNDTTIIKYLGYDKHVSIPANITEIGSTAFRDATSLKTINLGSVTEIGASAFRGCGLTEITIPASVTSIGSYAFAFMNYLKKATYNTDADMPNYLFSNCGNLSEVIINSDLKVIGEHTFGYCSALIGITLPNTLETIRSYAFYRSGLIEITIPASVTNIGSNAFFSSSMQLIKLEGKTEIPDSFSSSWNVYGDVDTYYYSYEFV